MYDPLKFEWTATSQRTYRYGPFSAMIATGLYWFRLFGYGLHIKDMTRYRLLASEHLGFRRRLVIGPWSIRLLTPAH
jgi:hypothetical protein